MLPSGHVGFQRVALVGDPILDGDVLSDRLAAIQRERRDIALRIDRGVIRAALRALRRQVDLFMLERQAGFMQRNVIR